jgi:cytochrome c oxidase cbb3-type subunit 3
MKHRTSTTWLAALVIAASGGLAIHSFRADAGPSAGNPAAGKKLYAVKCVACHKADGSGGVKLTGNPTPNWRDAKRMADPKYSDDYLRDCITNGKIKSGMVAWAKQGLKPADIENLMAHIRTFSKK